MAESNDWWTCPTESEDGRLIIVSGRRDIDIFRRNPKFSIRVEITWRYSDALSADMPDDATAQMMGDVTDALEAEFTKDPVAIMTGIYTGAGDQAYLERWCERTALNLGSRSLGVFSESRGKEAVSCML